MYKRRSAAMQRYHKVHEIDVAPINQAVDGDFIPSAANMSLEECMSERRQLVTELTKLDQGIVIAKRTNQKREQEALGSTRQTLQARLSLIKQRMHEIRQRDSVEAFTTATKQIVPPEMLERIFERQQEIIAGGICG